ncbi:hypothetical protein [Bradyrhizobium sp. LTSPM299]|uniref:AbiU2 domain-containing protein n=1 Tax=Bradyrhizobium sp. LTSPM299 TaxID=1619233 RepID=UPI0012E25060|nr:hypothetical protein [Bradyrhizobium sp. LTSPM299]
MLDSFVPTPFTAAMIATAACGHTREFESSELMASIKNHRDKYLAHSLRSTRREKLGPVLPLQYGNETTVLEKSLPIIEALYCWVNGTSFSLTSSQASDRKNAQALWGACTFEAGGR